jgi:hypothetical protein
VNRQTVATTICEKVAIPSNPDQNSRFSGRNLFRVLLLRGLKEARFTAKHIDFPGASKRKIKEKAKYVARHNPRHLRTALSIWARMTPEILPAGGLAKRPGSSERN